MSRADNGRLAPEPVAIVGIGCRFPGNADTPDQFWDLLLSGVNTAEDMPAERWRPYEAKGPDFVAAMRQAVRRASFITGIEEFDADFFGISPREAELMDPQQRILLEVAWESLEHAGIPPRSLAGTEAGVFVGVCADDYGRQQLEDLPTIEGWTGIGAAACALSNRISYVLDLRGPSLTVDTACSSSLVSVHLACQSLRLGESSLALAAGVNLMVSPGETITLGLAGALAADGRSKSFDAAADGYGRGEGCGALVLKLLSDARRDGDRVLALVRGSGVNQDGRTDGIMAPCGEAQEHVMTRACGRAQVPPETVGYVEAHGTGTRLGDPMEAAAIASVYGQGRPAGRPCRIGSVKSNIGHLEGAAGISGVIKTALCLVNDQIPASPLVSGLNPDIPWAESGLSVVTENTPWPRTAEPRRAAVSGFGYGGTVAHVILEEAPAESQSAPADPAERATTGEVRAYPLSGASPAALRELAGGLSDRLADQGAALPLASVGHTLAHRRSHLAHRAVVLAGSGAELADKLRALAADRPADGVVTGTPPRVPGAGLVWVFSGHGSQWDGMGRELLATEPAFARVVDTLEPILLEEIGFSPRDLLVNGEIDGVDRIQTMIFVMQAGLAAVWREHGVEPDAVIGHSLGEIAAAVTAGALSLADGGRLSCRRSRLLRRVAGQGAMAMVGLPFAEVADQAAGVAGVVAAISASPESTVVAGDPAGIAAISERWQSQGIFLRTVASDVAFHSPHMDPLLDEVIESSASLTPQTPQLPMYSTSQPDLRFTPAPDGFYWAANLRNPVHLTSAVTAAMEDGYRAFLEVSPHPVVTHSLGEILDLGGTEDSFIGGTLRRHRGERAELLAAAGALHCYGIAIDWTRLQPAGELVTLPRTPWQHRRLWKAAVTASGAGSAGHDVDSHTLLGMPLSVAGNPVRAWHTVLEDATRPYPGSHMVHGAEIVPAAVLLTTFLRAASDGADQPVLASVAMRQPLITTRRREVQVVRDGGKLRLASRAWNEEGEGWLTHATAEVPPDADPRGQAGGPLPGDWSGADSADPGLIRERLAAVGVPDTGFEWTVEKLWRSGRALRAAVSVTQPDQAPATWAPVFDAATSIAPAAYPGVPVLRMLTWVDELAISGAPPPRVTIQVVPDETRDDAVEALVADPGGRVIARLAGLRYPEIGAETSGSSSQALLQELCWRPVQPDAQPGARTADAGPIVVLGGDDQRRERISQALGAECRAAAQTADIGTTSAHVLVLPPAPRPRASAADAALRAADWLDQAAQQLLTLNPPPRLWLMTQGAAEPAGVAGLADATAWGTARVVYSRHPELRGGVIDLDPGTEGVPAQTLLSVLHSNPREDVLVIRGETVQAARLARPGHAAARAVAHCRPDASYLVTGALSETGLAAAGWLADRGARRVVLADHRTFPLRAAWGDPADEQTRAQIAAVRALEARGVTVRILSLNLQVVPQAALMLAPDNLGLPAIRGVVHAAGLPEGPADARPSRKSLVNGAWVLHDLFPVGSLDFLVLLSSADSLLGVPGGDGTTDAFLDAIALHRAGYGDTIGLSVTGVGPSQLFETLDHADRHGPGRYAVLGTFPGDTDLPLLAELTAEEPGDHEAEDASSWSQLSADELSAVVTADIAVEMRVDPSDLDPRRPLVEQGLDSVMTVVVRRRLEKRFGQPLPATLLWHRPTVMALVEHLLELLCPAGDQVDEPSAEHAAAG